MMKLFVFTIFAVVLNMMGSRPCEAHSINVFAAAEGNMISGYAYSRGGDRIRQQPIIIQNIDGLVLGETTTDDNGEFTFSAAQRIDHVIVLETADGHRATFTVSAGELPETLPATSGTSADSGTKSAEEKQPSEPKTTAESLTPLEPTAQGVTKEEIEQVVETIVSRHVRPLREQLEAYESKTRLHDTLGGIGYIIGIAGIAFYFLGKRA